MVVVLQPPQSGTHSHLAFATLPLPILSVAFLKLTPSSRLSVTPSGSPKCLSFCHFLTLRTIYRHSRGTQGAIAPSRPPPRCPNIFLTNIAPNFFIFFCTQPCSGVYSGHLWVRRAPTPRGMPPLQFLDTPTLCTLNIHLLTYLLTYI